MCSPDEFWGNSTGIDDWYEKEHIPYNLAFDNITFTQLIFAAEDGFATTTTYGKGRCAIPQAVARRVPWLKEN